MWKQGDDMRKVIGLILIIVLALAVSTTEARERVNIVKVRTLAGQEFSGKLTCNSNQMIEITSRSGEVRSFTYDTLAVVWKGTHLGLECAGLGMMVGFAVGSAGRDDQDKHPDLFRPFSFMMGGTLVFAFIGSLFRVWETSKVQAMPIIECDPPLDGGPAGLKVGLVLRF